MSNAPAIWTRYRWPLIAGVALIVAAAMSLSLGSRAQSAEGPPGDIADWELVFSDEFDGGELDDDRWTTCYWWDRGGCTNLGNNELEWYLPDNVWVEDGNLILEAREEKVRGDGETYPYTSGMVTTGRTDPEGRDGDRFSLTYGYIEVRARIPSGKGLWPAVWLLPSDHTSVPEIDVMEVLGHAPDTLEMHYHSRVDGDEQSDGTDVRVDDLSKDFHTYAVEWTENEIIWVLDGEEMWRFSDRERVADSNEPLYLLINLAVGGNWPGSPDENTVFPARMLIDHVRIWQRAQR
jgi:beta-glucanase (GH16 family)